MKNLRKFLFGFLFSVMIFAPLSNTAHAMIPVDEMELVDLSLTIYTNENAFLFINNEQNYSFDGYELRSEIDQDEEYFVGCRPIVNEWGARMVCQATGQTGLEGTAKVQLFLEDKVSNHVVKTNVAELKLVAKQEGLSVGMNDPTGCKLIGYYYPVYFLENIAGEKFEQVTNKYGIEIVDEITGLKTSRCDALNWELNEEQFKLLYDRADNFTSVSREDGGRLSIRAQVLDRWTKYYYFDVLPLSNPTGCKIVSEKSAVEGEVLIALVNEEGEMDPEKCVTSEWRNNGTLEIEELDNSRARLTKYGYSSISAKLPSGEITREFSFSIEGTAPVETCKLGVYNTGSNNVLTVVPKEDGAFGGFGYGCRVKEWEILSGDVKYIAGNKEQALLQPGEESEFVARAVLVDGTVTEEYTLSTADLSRYEEYEAVESEMIEEEKITFGTTRERVAISESILTNEAGFEDVVRTKLVVEKSPFADLDLVSLVGKSAAFLYTEGIAGGFADGNFHQERGVTRAAAAKFLLRAKGVRNFSSSLGKNAPADVLEGEWYTPYITEALVRSVMEGDHLNRARPADGVLRAEFLKMMAENFGIEKNSQHSYTDVAAGVWYEEYVGMIEKYDLFPTLESKTELRAWEKMTRGEVAIALYQYMNNR